MKKKLFFIAAALFAVGTAAKAQTTPPPPPPPPPPMAVPDSYLDTHCFIQNSYKEVHYFLVSLDKQNWREQKIKGHGTMDIEVTDSVFFKMQTSKNVSTITKAVPGKYYALKYNAGLKKWVIEARSIGLK